MNNEITLTDLFEVEMLQRLQDSFSKMTGFAAIITDAEGVPVTKGTNFTDFCSNYTRNSPIGCDASSVTNTAQSSPSRWDPP